MNEEGNLTRVTTKFGTYPVHRHWLDIERRIRHWINTGYPKEGAPTQTLTLAEYRYLVNQSQVA